MQVTRLRLLRLGFDLTQQKLADSSGVHRRWIGMAENGRYIPKREELAALAGPLNWFGEPAALMDVLTVPPMSEEDHDPQEGAAHE